ncbi:hypothetical protein [Nocardioides marmorisolisilvae]|uniref:DUF2867 domain-containing protein n=1 Tax=Nocardioides marmorisolisilvae TaxID=1542737 RepID=A0A3N0E086_9ACTN|nr:hypothetical protein [Nocardioides marmorisolisilvae]RNL81262.1 hypothetical protein EFL95_02545 [Nocardioides marmorisolisilvae]
MAAALAPEYPYIDEHSVLADVPADVLWDSVRRTFERPLTGVVRRYAALVGAEGGRAFVVDSAERPGLLGLVGAHRFSRYALTFTFEPLGPDRTRMTARTNAVFPGVAGQLYKTAVIRSRAHRVLTKAMIRGLARRATTS